MWLALCTSFLLTVSWPRSLRNFLLWHLCANLILILQRINEDQWLVSRSSHFIFGTRSAVSICFVSGRASVPVCKRWTKRKCLAGIRPRFLGRPFRSLRLLYLLSYPLYNVIRYWRVNCNSVTVVWEQRGLGRYLHWMVVNRYLAFTRLRLVQRLRTGGAKPPPPPHLPSWSVRLFHLLRETKPTNAYTNI